LRRRWSDGDKHSYEKGDSHRSTGAKAQAERHQVLLARASDALGRTVALNSFVAQATLARPTAVCLVEFA
jgi:hypothetical protein